MTGGARRVGRAVALALADADMDVALTCRTSGDEAENVVRAIEAKGRRALAIHVDLAEADADEQVERAFRARFDSMAVLVNSASIFAPCAVADVTNEEFDRNLAINARAPLMLIRRFRPLLAAHEVPGRIVNFIDIHVMGQPLGGYVAYNASKAALAEITMTCAMELAPHVTVNAIAPGVVAWAERYTEAERREYLRRVPLGRPGTPEDAARTVMFLVRDASYCTGQVIRLDGGRLLT